MSSDPSPQGDKPRRLGLTTEAWVVLAFLIGAVPWVVQAVLLLWPALVP